MDVTERVVKIFIFQKILADESFTAHDITRALRSSIGPGAKIRHDDVRIMVHCLMDRDSDIAAQNYQRDLDRSLPGLPWRYSPSEIVDLVDSQPKMTRDEALALGRPLGGKAIVDKKPPEKCPKCGADMSNKMWHEYLAHLSLHARGKI